MMRARPLAVGLAAVIATALLLTATAGAQTQSSAQQSCINGLNKAGAKVAATQAKLSLSCLKNAGAGGEPNAQACLTADAKLAVAKAAAKTASTDAKKCAVGPDFGRAAVATINDAAEGEEIALVGAVFGPDLGAAAVLRATDKTAAGCQLAVAKAYERLAAAKLKRFLRCKKAGLQSATIASTATLATCFDAIAVDPAVAKAAAKLAAAVASKCAGVTLGTVFPGDCAAAGTFATCVDERVECHVCLMLDAMDALARDCDLFDDGLANGSCANLPATPTVTPTPTATLTATPTPTVTTTPSPTPTSTCGGTVYAEDFTAPNGSPWPAPWTPLGSVDVADVQTGRGRFRPTLSGYSLARLGVGLNESDVEATFTVEFENIAQQGVGFYVRQNGGYLQQTTPHGQGYAVFVEGFRGFQGIGVWREVDGVEQQLLIDMGQTIANGTRYRVRFQVEQATAGTTDLRAKMWPEAGSEPAGWDVEYTDNAAVLQGVAGSIAADSWSSLTTGGPTPAYTFIDDVAILPLCP